MASHVYRSPVAITLGNAPEAIDALHSGLKHLLRWGILWQSIGFDGSNFLILTLRNNEPQIPADNLEHLRLVYVGTV